MAKDIVLTHQEALLIMIITQTPTLLGIPELALGPDTRIGPEVRGGLIEKKLLLLKENGRLGLDARVGDLFLSMRDTGRYLEGDLYEFGEFPRRHNLYFVGDLFILATQEENGQLHLITLPSIQLAVGSILNCLRREAEKQCRGETFRFVLHDRDKEEEYQYSIDGTDRFSVFTGQQSITGNLAETVRPLSEQMLQMHIQSFGGEMSGSAFSDV